MYDFARYVFNLLLNLFTKQVSATKVHRAEIARLQKKKRMVGVTVGCLGRCGVALKSNSDAAYRSFFFGYPIAVTVALLTTTRVLD